VLIAARLDPRRRQHVGEVAVAPVAEQHRPGPVVADVEVERAVAVDVADGRVVRGAHARDAGGLGDVDELRQGNARGPALVTTGRRGQHRHETHAYADPRSPHDAHRDVTARSARHRARSCGSAGCFPERGR
jgi:hypothetical protein